MKPWKDQDEMFSLMREKLYTPVVGDILDQMGLVHQFLPQDIRPLRDDMKLAGKAMTVLMTDVYGKQEKPFGYLTEALDQLEKNEIYIAAGGTAAAHTGASCLPLPPEPGAPQARCWMAGTGIPRRCWHRTGRCSVLAATHRIPVCALR